ncbi:gamma-glutamylcyclotransferase [Ruegeria sp. 2205SS24-7]|uniref:gamma-glutamylcyclotransferase n=1 Tax=Ruegeria discodermiae TaxID=3064389 RepID=UPI0027422E14|nr:gamma-glutamylcyclotransferase [Ruegeria sp. 2205SS24-7]MDP5220410.1 gamma-glutamylcyclotransferase [Ruegeria sp. 2205SS24-7]
MEQLQRAQMEAAISAVRQANQGDLVIAAYGSLPDRPEAGMEAVSRAMLPGFRKSMCVRVASCRGSPDAPGLVAGLIPEAGSAAMAMLMQAADPTDPILAQRLSLRELNGKAYTPLVVHLDLPDGSARLALGFAAEVWHCDFWTGPAEVAAGLIAKASGECGANEAYLDAVVAFERRVFGAVTPELDAIQRALR